MTDVVAAQPDPSRSAVSRPHHLPLLQLLARVIGLGAAALGIWGFFVNIIHMANTSLAAASGWWSLIPISTGIAAGGLVIPRAVSFTSGLPLLGMGMLFLNGPFFTARVGPNPGYGFWMIAVGSGVLTLAGLAILVLDGLARETPRRLSDSSGTSGPVQALADPGGWRRPLVRTLSTSGLLAGVAGFVGFFVDFNEQAGSALSSWNVGGWWFFVPISIGLGTLGLLIPRARVLTAGLPLMALGLCLGFRVYYTTIRLPEGVPPGSRFWMITVGAGVVVLAGWSLIAIDVPRRV